MVNFGTNKLYYNPTELISEIFQAEWWLVSASETHHIYSYTLYVYAMPWKQIYSALVVGETL